MTVDVQQAAAHSTAMFDARLPAISTSGKPFYNKQAMCRGYYQGAAEYSDGPDMPWAQTAEMNSDPAGVTLSLPSSDGVEGIWKACSKPVQGLQVSNARGGHSLQDLLQLGSATKQGRAHHVRRQGPAPTSLGQLLSPVTYLHVQHPGCS